MRVGENIQNNSSPSKYLISLYQEPKPLWSTKEDFAVQTRVLLPNNSLPPPLVIALLSRPRIEQSLVRWAMPQLHDIDALSKMVDPALKGLYPVILPRFCYCLIYRLLFQSVGLEISSFTTL
ncbi:hypothetical protein Vadar_001015 [Vaccinium darrowii]|uniref:Uncharacterized protein n=1 Tax=Vaccinium darrowii TaxID=229202 RepID=A0ACB7YS75_9ERIC|nr:hypothetical protein Vadar_001015 [Vaccinium darrowii]